MPREITVDWTTDAGAGFVSVMYFNEGVAVATQRADLDTFLGSVAGALDSGTTYTIATSGREWNSTTGALTGAWTETTAYTGPGLVSGQAVPDATQILFRWQTGTIVNGRFLSGRTFIPGCAAINQDEGNLEESLRAAIEANGVTFAGSAATPVVWHRPVAGTGGQQVQMTDCSVWEEFAVLRGRRK
jgi:hypothetical protein